MKVEGGAPHVGALRDLLGGDAVVVFLNDQFVQRRAQRLAGALDAAICFVSLLSLHNLTFF